MRRPDDGEVPAVKRCDLGDSEPLAGCDHRTVNGAERQVLVPRDQLRDAHPVAGERGFDEQVAAGDISKEADLSLSAEARLEKVGDFGDDEYGNEQRARMLLEQMKTLFMVSVVSVDIGVQRACVDQYRYRATSARRISSIRSEMSECPLWPTPAAIRRRWERRPPRCDSMASLVSSETVVRRRAASWRSLASSSSGSLTVVRFMVCQHTA